MQTSQELIALLDLKNLGNNTFSGDSYTIGSPHVFGGQVLAQAVNAAYRTIPENRFLHSLHSYFLEPGDFQSNHIHNNGWMSGVYYLDEPEIEIKEAHQAINAPTITPVVH